MRTRWQIGARRWTAMSVAMLLVGGCAGDARRDLDAEALVAQPADLVVPEGDRREYTFPSLGGVRVEVFESHGVYAEGDRVMIDPIGGPDPYRSGAAYIGLATQASDGSSVGTVDDFLARLSGIELQPTGDALELFGYGLVGYSSQTAESGVDRETFASTRIGADGRFTWAPDRDVIYLADTPAGVLYAGYDTGGVPENPVALPAFALLVSSAALTGPGLGAELPRGTTPTAGGPRPSPASVAADGPPPLQITFADVGPGRYQLPNFGQKLSIDIDAWWVKPNQPGIVALARRDSAGAGDSAVVFIGGLEPHLVPQTGGPARVGKPIDLSDLGSFLNEPPPGLEVSNVEEVEVAGVAATRFDVRITEGESCAQSDPCEFAFETTWPWNFPLAIQAELAHRIWWFADHPTGVAVIHASDLDPAFLDLASDLVASARALE